MKALAQVFAKNYFQDEKAASCCVTLLFENIIISAKLVDTKSNKRKANISLPKYL